MSSPLRYTVNCSLLFTELPLSEVKRLEALQGQEINDAIGGAGGIKAGGFS